MCNVQLCIVDGIKSKHISQKLETGEQSKHGSLLTMGHTIYTIENTMAILTLHTYLHDNIQ